MPEPADILRAFIARHSQEPKILANAPETPDDLKVFDVDLDDPKSSGALDADHLERLCIYHSIIASKYARLGDEPTITPTALLHEALKLKSNQNIYVDLSVGQRNVIKQDIRQHEAACVKLGIVPLVYNQRQGAKRLRSPLYAVPITPPELKRSTIGCEPEEEEPFGLKLPDILAPWFTPSINPGWLSNKSMFLFAAPGDVGKSDLLITMAVENARAGKRVVYLSFEHTETEMTKYVGQRLGVPTPQKNQHKQHALIAQRMHEEGLTDLLLFHEIRTGIDGPLPVRSIPKILDECSADILVVDYISDCYLRGHGGVSSDILKIMGPLVDSVVVAKGIPIVSAIQSRSDRGKLVTTESWWHRAHLGIEAVDRVVYPSLVVSHEWLAESRYHEEVFRAPNTHFMVVKKMKGKVAMRMMPEIAIGVNDISREITHVMPVIFARKNATKTSKGYARWECFPGYDPAQDGSWDAQRWGVSQ